MFRWLYKRSVRKLYPFATNSIQITLSLFACCAGNGSENTIPTLHNKGVGGENIPIGKAILAEMNLIREISTLLLSIENAIFNCIFH